MIESLKKNRYLLHLLVRNEIKRKYRGSFLGVIWSLLSPLLDMIVLTIVFSSLLSRNIDNFPVFLLTGRLLFGFFSSATKTAMVSIVNSSSLIRKINVSKITIVFSKLISSFYIFLISLIDLAILMIITGAHMSLYSLYAPLYLLLLFLFVSGCGMVLATINVYFRDVTHIYDVLITAVMYASCIFYHPDIIPEKYHLILNLNPMYHYISGFRNVLYYGNNIEIGNLMVCVFISFIAFTLGMLIFRKFQGKFVLYI